MASLFSGVGESLGRVQELLSAKQRRKLESQALGQQGIRDFGNVVSGELDRRNVLTQKTMDEEAAAIQTYMSQGYTRDQAVEQVRSDEADTEAFNLGHRENVTGFAEDIATAQARGPFRAEFEPLIGDQSPADLRLQSSLDFLTAQTDATAERDRLQGELDVLLADKDIDAAKQAQITQIEADIANLELRIQAEQASQVSQQDFAAGESALGREADVLAQDKAIGLSLTELEQQSSQFLANMSQQDRQFYDDQNQETKIQMLRQEQAIASIEAQGAQTRQTDVAATDNQIRHENWKANRAVELLDANPALQSILGASEFYPVDATGEPIAGKVAESMINIFDTARSQMFDLAHYGEMYPPDEFGEPAFNEIGARDYLFNNDLISEQERTNMSVQDVKVMLDKSLYDSTMQDFEKYVQTITQDQDLSKGLVSLYQQFYEDPENLLSEYNLAFNGDVPDVIAGAVPDLIPASSTADIVNPQFQESVIDQNAQFAGVGAKLKDVIDLFDLGLITQNDYIAAQDDMVSDDKIDDPDLFRRVSIALQKLQQRK